MNEKPTLDWDRIERVLFALHDVIRDGVVRACERQAIEDLSAVADEDADGDTIYAIDKVSEELLIQRLGEDLAKDMPILLVAEGVEGGRKMLPDGTPEREAVLRVIVDPIDGTRGLMFQKRSGWILTGVAPERGEATALSDIELAVMTEIPLTRQHLSDRAWVRRGGKPRAQRYNRLTGDTVDVPLGPSSADGFEHGCVTFARFFPGARDVLAAVDEQVTAEMLGDQPAGKALCFEDQYACTGGQLYELMTGRDRFVADLRPLVSPILAERGQPTGLCCHPYDLCTVLVAQAAGVVVTDAAGGELDAPLNLEADVSWIGYANPGLRRRAEPAVMRALRDHGLSEDLT